MNVYEIVTKQILEKLQQGIIPWKKAWRSRSNLAYNRVTKKKYSFLNQMILKHTGEYASFKQWQQLGGKVKKGEKGEQVVFWTFLYKDENGKDKVKMTVTKISYYYGFDNEGRNGESYKAEEWISDKEALNKAGTKLYPRSGKFRRKTVDRIDEIFAGARNVFEAPQTEIIKQSATVVE